MVKMLLVMSMECKRDKHLPNRRTLHAKRLPNVHANLSSKGAKKQQESPIKYLQTTLDKFIDQLKYDSEVKIQLARDHLAIIQQIQL